jgi:hypothetical protein
MKSFKTKANKLVNKFAREMQISKEVARHLTAKYLFDTMQGIATSDFTDDEKRALQHEYYNTLKALNNETTL